MPEDGFLVLGAAETVIGLTEAFKPLADKHGLYVLNMLSKCFSTTSNSTASARPKWML
jgi:chemotaxis protein methyltransferase CheR